MSISTDLPGGQGRLYSHGRARHSHMIVDLVSTQSGGGAHEVFARLGRAGDEGEAVTLPNLKP